MKVQTDDLVCALCKDSVVFTTTRQVTSATLPEPSRSHRPSSLIPHDDTVPLVWSLGLWKAPTASPHSITMIHQWLHEHIAGHCFKSLLNTPDYTGLMTEISAGLGFDFATVPIYHPILSPCIFYNQVWNWQNDSTCHNFAIYFPLKLITFEWQFEFRKFADNLASWLVVLLPIICCDTILSCRDSSFCCQ